VRTHDGRSLDGELHGWDPATGLALVRAAGIDTAPAKPATEPARVGNLAIAVGRSWSDAVTASVRIVSGIGRPLRTGQGRSSSGGLRIGDSIVSFDGQQIDDPEDLLDLLTEERVGKTVDISIVRGDGAKELKVTIGER